ncbi:MAG: helix-turn-helix domain-containing protein [Actinobacteria bacterium]|nr:helix-turn-helix domain-containing protein [Actinomycetota bacterium]
MIDALSLSLGRAVLFDDTDLTPLAYSRQWDVDAVRSQSILTRGARPEVREALLAQGIEDAEDVVHTEGDAALEMDERVCLPVRRGGELLGYLWLLGPEEDLREADLGRLRQAAAEIALLLDGRGDGDVADEAELFAALLSARAEERVEAASAARARGLLAEGPVVVCAVAPRDGGGDPLASARRVVRRLSVNHAIVARVGSHAAVVASSGDPVLRVLPVSEIGAWVAAAAGGGVTVGQAAPADLSALASAWRQAQIALRVALSHGPQTGAVAWPNLGADRLIAQLPASSFEDLPEGIARLVETEPALAQTLTAFLDAGGDVKAVSERLSLHRSGVYYRLQRIEAITGLDLHRGDDRLLAHLAVRIYGFRAR